MLSDSSKGKVPTIFVSSTCYDLSQVRADLKDFIEAQLGFEAMLSETSSFPANPDLNTVESCLNAINDYVDIFVLIVGGRYGYITDTGKSVTNLEYICAKEKGVPIYVFVDSKIINMLSIWKDNPEGNFSSVVNTTKLFEFVDTLRGKENIWVYSFEYAQQIIEILRKQLAHLLLTALKLRKQVESAKLSNSMINLTGEPLKILIEKPLAWEYKIFGQVLEDEIKKSEDLKRDLKYRISLGNSKTLINYTDISTWLQEKTNDFLIMTSSLTCLINEALPEALGEPGEPSDINHLVYIAQKIAEMYKRAIQIGLEVQLVTVDEEFKNIITCPLNICNQFISDIEKFKNTYQEKMVEIKNPPPQGETITLKFVLELTTPDLTDFYNALDKIRMLYGLSE